jgi:fumarate hydratase subunit beta
MIYKLTTPLTDEKVMKLKAGDEVLLSGVIYTARDAAHKRLLELIEKDIPLPFDPTGQIVYYVGPSPSKPGEVIGSAGPTTSYRMDDMTEPLFEKGLRGTIGKGKRAASVATLMKAYRGVYFVAIGGIGALMSQSITKSEIVAFEELGTEAIRRLEVVDMPLYVGIDSMGNDIYCEEVGI